jgi:hypothetical protein
MIPAHPHGLAVLFNFHASLRAVEDALVAFYAFALVNHSVPARPRAGAVLGAGATLDHNAETLHFLFP